MAGESDACAPSATRSPISAPMSRTADAGPPLSELVEPPEPDSGPVVSFEGVGLGYGGGPEILKDLNFELEPGSFHFITGASGAGKTSLLRMIQMALRPTRGVITLFGRNTTSLERA